MKKQAKIYLIEKDGSISAIFSGTVEDNGHGYYIEYEDGDGVACVIGFTKGIASLTRTKDPIYTVILEENTPSSFEIRTPFGNIDAIAHPITVKSYCRGKTRTISLVYDLVIGTEKFRHELKLRAIEIVDN